MTEIIYTREFPFGKPPVTIRGQGVKVKGVPAFLKQRGFQLNADGRWETEIDARGINVVLHTLVKKFGCSIRWDNMKAAPVPVEPVKVSKLRPVAVEDMKVGMEIHGHGIVKSAGPFVGESWVKKGKNWKRIKPDGKGPRGFLFKTDAHPNGCYYVDGSTVWCVVRKKGVKNA